MKDFINITQICDITDPDDSQNRTYREINNAKSHVYKVGQLVELESGARLYVAYLTRDCDGTPMVTLTPYKPVEGDEDMWFFIDQQVLTGYMESSLSPVEVAL